MDLINWIEKNSFKDIDEELSVHIVKLESLKSEKEKLISRINSHKTSLKNLKEILNSVNTEIAKTNKVALKSLKATPVISIGFDTRSSTYICIVKCKKVTKSFYLGNESKLKNKLQQFYAYDLNTKRMEYIKMQVKMIVSNVISDFINPRSKHIFTINPKLNFKNVLDKFYESGLWEHWKSV